MNDVAAKWRLLPQPRLSALLLVAWLWLNESVAPGHLLLGAALALAIPLLTQRWRGDPVVVRDPWALVRFLLVVMRDVLVANVQVAMLVLGPRSRWRPGFVRVPLDLRSDHSIAVLAAVVTLTPGTVSVGVERAADGRRWLVVHALRCLDEQAVVAEVKERYERRVAQVFGC